MLNAQQRLIKSLKNLCNKVTGKKSTKYSVTGVIDDIAANYTGTGGSGGDVKVGIGDNWVLPTAFVNPYVSNLHLDALALDFNLADFIEKNLNVINHANTGVFVRPTGYEIIGIRSTAIDACYNVDQSYRGLYVKVVSGQTYELQLILKSRLLDVEEETIIQRVEVTGADLNKTPVEVFREFNFGMNNDEVSSEIATFFKDLISSASGTSTTGYDFKSIYFASYGIPMFTRLYTINNVFKAVFGISLDDMLREADNV